MAEQAEKELGERRGRRRKGEEEEDTGEEGREERAKQRELMKVYPPPMGKIFRLSSLSNTLLLERHDYERI